MTFGSLFAGIGGMDLGLERAGLRCVWQVEIEPFCRHVLAKHWPNVPRWDDVKTFTGESFERPDVICGGFPCQDISYAGPGAGLDGKRSGLWFEFARIIRKMGPRFVVVENVAALLTRGLDRVLGTLADLGYDAEWSSFPACSLGAPHTRDRVFIVANRDEIGWRAGWHSHGEHAVSGRRQWEAAPRGEWGNVVRWIGQALEDGREVIPPAERGGNADGVPNRMERIAGCGNAVVPQIAEWIGRRLMTKE